MSVLGLRRSGKTSFLQYVSHPEVMARHLPDPERYKMVYLDVSFCKTPGEFYYRLLRRLEAALSGKQSEIRVSNGDPAEARMYDVENILPSFGDQRIVLLLDEFDQLRTGKFTQDFLTELRALTSGWEYELACVTASYWDLYRLGAQLGLPPTSPFYNIFYPLPVYMDGLEPVEWEELVASPAEAEGILVSDSDIAAVRELAGTLPFFLQATAAQWFQDHGRSRPSLAALQSDMVTAMGPYFEQWWRHFDPCEQAILQAVVQGQSLGDLPFSPAESRDSLNRLVNFGTLVDGDNGLEPNGQVFRIWLEARVDSAEVEPALQTNGHAAEGLDPVQIRRVLSSYFNLEELRVICFDLDIDPDELAGSNKGLKSAELVNHCKRVQRMDDLVAAIRRERGEVI